jgi:hypothetical protein
MVTVYLISAESNGKKLYKIGYTRRNVSERIKDFKTGNTSVFEIVDSFSSKWGTKIEKAIHKIFKEKRVSGEWFDLCESDISLFYEKCLLIHNNLEFINERNTYFIDRGFRF